MKKLKIVYISAECSPYSRVGGLGDVAEALPKELAKKDARLVKIAPLHRSEKNAELKYVCDFPIKMGKYYQSCIIRKDDSNRAMPVFFIQNDYYFNRDNIYRYYDDGERYLFFCKAAIEAMKRIRFKPDIVHCNDWHTGFIPLMLKKEESAAKTLFTIHNIAYQGSIQEEYLDEIKLTYDEKTSLGYPGNLNFMAAALKYADDVNTVSPGYAKEIASSGAGMEKILSERHEEVKGILNGIDVSLYNPQNKEEIPVTFGVNSINNRKQNKELLQKELGLDVQDVPVIASIGRLDELKGIGIMLEAIESIKGNFQFVLLGCGNEYYEMMFRQLAQDYQSRCAVINRFDSKLAKRIYAGSDIFLMPSKVEPCGLAQMYAMRYGCIPVVRSTGGLKDTVRDAQENIKTGNGIVFEKYSASALKKAITRAIDMYNGTSWNKIIKNAMKCDWSWEKPASEYMKVYKHLVG